MHVDYPKKIDLKKNLPQYPFKAAKILFAVDKWDGPTAGLCLLKGREYWFDLLEESYPRRKRRRVFALIRLSKDQIAEERLWHRLFGLLVNNGKKVRPQEWWPRFYGPYEARPKITVKPEDIVGKLVHV